MRTIWLSMNDAQATVIAACLTIIAALIGVLLGSMLFGNRVRNLKTALQKTEDEVKAFGSRIEEQLKDVEPQIAAVLKIVRELRTEAEDLPQSEEAPETHEAAVVTRDNLKAVWHEVRDKIESIASDAAIGGRTRAKYSRFPRYSYEDLIRSMSQDGNLNGHAGLFLEANSIWQNYQRRPALPTQVEFNRLQQIRDEVLQLVLPRQNPQNN